jgi:hypothetical protein
VNKFTFLRYNIHFIQILHYVKINNLPQMKKNALALILLLISVIGLFAQGNIDYSIKVIDNNNVPLKDIKISAFEKASFRTVDAKTNSNGIASLRLNNGKDWLISIGEIKNELSVSAIPFNIIQLSRVYVYDLNGYNRKKLQDKDRVNDNFKVVEQNFRENTPFQPPNCMLIVKVRQPSGKRLSGLDVQIVNIKDSIIYKSKTNSNGDASFILLNQNNYEIDINGVKNYSYSDFDSNFIQRPLTIEYIPTIVNERVVNDTIYQNITNLSQASSERALVRVNVRGGTKNGKNEVTFLRELKLGKVYTSNTNSEGFALFLVPIGFIYMIDFTFQHNVDAINFINAKGVTTGELDVLYSPNPRLEFPEKFIPTPENLFITDFNSFLEKQYKKSTTKPFILKILGKKINKNSREALFKITLAGSDNYGESIRLPSNIAFILDKSGSMYSEERSEALKKSLTKIGTYLTDGDIVTVVLFDEEAYTVMHSDSNHLHQFRTIIHNYSPSGGTNIYKGLQIGADHILKDYNSDRSNRVILLTDGYGQTPPKEITDFVESMSKEGLEFSTIGLGQSHNQALLQLIAQSGKGTFNYVNNSVNLSEVIEKEVKNTLSYNVKELKIDIVHNKELLFSNLYGYPTTNETEESFSIGIGKLPHNVNQVAFLKFKLNNPTSLLESKPLIMKVSYFDLVQNKTISYEEKVQLEWTDETKTEDLLNQEEKELYAIAILNQSLKTMADAYGQKDKEAAKDVLQKGIQQIEGIFPDAKPRKIKQLLSEVENYITLFKQIEDNEN